MTHRSPKTPKILPFFEFPVAHNSHGDIHDEDESPFWLVGEVVFLCSRPQKIGAYGGIFIPSNIEWDPTQRTPKSKLRSSY